MNWRNLFAALVLLPTLAWGQPTGSTPPNPCLNMLTCTETGATLRGRFTTSAAKFRTGSGTVTTSNMAVTGSNTQFLTEVERGDTICIDPMGSYQCRTVSNTITSNTSLQVRAPGFYPDFGSATGYRIYKPHFYGLHPLDSTLQTFLIGPFSATFGQQDSCAQRPCSPHAFFAIAQPSLDSHPTISRNMVNVLDVLGANGISLTNDNGGSSAGNGAGSTFTMGDGGNSIGDDTAGNGGAISYITGEGGELASPAGGGAGAGVGGAMSVTLGVGGAITGTGSGSTAGTGGSFTVSAGAGGTAVTGNTEGNGGNITLNAGAGATAGAGTDGSNGAIRLGSTTGNVLIGTTTDAGWKGYLNGQLGMTEAPVAGAVASGDGVWGVENTSTTRGYFKNEDENVFYMGEITMTGSSTDACAGGTTTEYFPANGQGLCGATGSVDTVVPGAITVTKMACSVNVAPDGGGGTQTRVLTLQEDGVDTAVTCTISETATDCSWCVTGVTGCDSTGTAEALQSGDMMQIESTPTQASTVASEVTCTLWMTLDSF